LVAQSGMNESNANNMEAKTVEISGIKKNVKIGAK
jgi:hypothetical protein